MSRNIIFTICLMGSLFAYATTAEAEVIFSDSFESGDMSATNADGFTWDKNNKTSVVTMEPQCGGLSSGDATAIYNNKVICNGPNAGRDWSAKTGDNSLRFRYAAGKEWTEQRFSLNALYPDIWVSYWIRVPSNYSRGKNQSGGKNNKWFDILWGLSHSDYGSDGPRVEMQDWPSSKSSNMSIRIQLRQTKPHGFTKSSSYENFITPADAGRWMHVVYQGVSGDGNGAFRFWRRWENGTGYELINEINNAFITTGANGYTGWGYGYIMGYANMPYADDTEWLLDDFIVSDSSPFLNAPKPPNNLSVGNL